MGILSHLITYKVGRRQGRKAARRSLSREVVVDQRDPECIHYSSFCQNFGSCDGAVCEYE